MQTGAEWGECERGLTRIGVFLEIVRCMVKRGALSKSVSDVEGTWEGPSMAQLRVLAVMTVLSEDPRLAGLILLNLISSE